MNVINLENVGEKFRIPFKYDRGTLWQEFWALRNINLKVQRGECLGIVGENGSGKSTLLKIIAGILPADEGRVTVEGKVSSLLELGAGFNPELTGKENIYLQCSLFGLNRKDTDRIFKRIALFSGLNNFIYAPLKSYSGGMYVRLAFSIAINLDPDILLIDDILAVGDIYFQKKCIEKIEELKNSGKTLILVSHDLNLLNRFCSRGIVLREGRIIYEDSLKRIIPFYMQTIGEKRGIAIAQKAALGIIFNNGRLFINWNNSPLLHHWGGYTSIFHQGQLYPSVDATWECSGKGAEIHCRGEHLNIPVVEEWQLEMGSAGEILWNVNWRWKENLQINRAQIGLIFPHTYTRWLTVGNEGQFPSAFINARDWDNLHTTGKEEKIAGVMQEDFNLPAVVLLKNEECPIKIYNTGADIGGRAIHIEKICEKESQEHRFSSRIRLFDTKVSLDEFLKQERIHHEKKKSLLIAPDLNIYFEPSKVNISYKGNPLTAGSGLATFITFEQFKSSSYQANWEIVRTDPKSFQILLKNERLPIHELWEFTIKRRAVNWKVYIDTDEPLILKEIKIELLTSQYYNFWMSAFESGKFQEFKTGESEIEALLNNFTSSYLALSAGDEKPSIIFKLLNNSKEFFSTIYRRHEKDSICSVLCFRCLNIPSPKSLPSGRRCLFSSEIAMIDKRAEEELRSQIPKRYHRWQEQLLKNCQIESGKLRVIFEAGKGKILFEDRELTQGLHMYTSIHFMDFWVDSRHAIWKIKKLGENKLIAEGYWIHFPLLQVWEIEIVEENVIDWKIDQKILEPISYDREQTNIMLNENYIYWFAENRTEGEFPKEFTSQHPDLWERMWKGNVNEGDIGVRSKEGEFPEVRFETSCQSEEYKSIIVNSDELFSGRVLQTERINAGRQAHFSPSNYTYFTGRIIIAQNNHHSPIISAKEF